MVTLISSTSLRPHVWFDMWVWISCGEGLNSVDKLCTFRANVAAMCDSWLTKSFWRCEASLHWSSSNHVGVTSSKGRSKGKTFYAVPLRQCLWMSSPHLMQIWWKQQYKCVLKSLLVWAGAADVWVVGGGWGGGTGTPEACIGGGWFSNWSVYWCLCRLVQGEKKLGGVVEVVVDCCNMCMVCIQW